MKSLKLFLVLAIAIFGMSAANAQTSKKKGKVAKAKTAMHYQCPKKCEDDKTYHKSGKCPVCGKQMTPVKAAHAHVYQCPMKCEGEKTYAKAGKCPVCQMELTKMDAPKKEPTGHEGHNHN